MGYGKTVEAYIYAKGIEGPVSTWPAGRPLMLYDTQMLLRLP